MRLRTLFGWHLASSTLFFLGTLVPLLSHIEYKYFFEQEYAIGFKSAEAVGWVLLTFHVLPEIVVDMNTFPGRSRRLAHLRYGPTPWPNLAQSLVFAAACFFQGSYYVSEWYTGDEEDDNRTSAADVMNVIAGHFWVISGLLTAVSLGFRFMCCGTSQRLSLWEQMASDLYILTTVLLCFTSYINLLAPTLLEDQLQDYLKLDERLDYYLHLAVRCIWALIGLFYVLVDAQTMSHGKSRSSDKGGPASPLQVRNGAEYA
eukprot:CAMPEP_0198140506 /NCGR_PEP_ID=MMETSP1443-20131203/3657_1 /TAXON_ID=186043 /ORGANISM="Entomoneis sp., Strain CCMP2396" /LENGTH=258 /DNA_ID=CAMNT_0043802947 /DNA_START=91 /DNA_END=867 /DNA_ORIENTATION=-